MIIAGHRILTIDLTTRNQCRQAADATQFVKQRTSLFPGNTLHVDRRIRQVAGLGIVREGQMGHGDHFTHQFHLPIGHTVVEPSAITENRIHKDRCSQSPLFLTVAGHKFGLFFTEHQTCTDGIKREPEFFPDWQRPTDIIGGILNIKLPVIEGVRHQGRRQTISRNTQIRQNRQHSTHAHLAVAYHIINQ